MNKWLLVLALATLISRPSSLQAQTNCAFVLGFKTLHDLSPKTVGVAAA
jgi:hypothetical protein